MKAGSPLVASARNAAERASALGRAEGSAGVQ